MSRLYRVLVQLPLSDSSGVTDEMITQADRVTRVNGKQGPCSDLD